jgi:hypothetical protein
VSLWEKIAKNVAQPIFFQHEYLHNFYRGKKTAFAGYQTPCGGLWVSEKANIVSFFNILEVNILEIDILELNIMEFHILEFHILEVGILELNILEVGILEVGILELNIL